MLDDLFSGINWSSLLPLICQVLVATVAAIWTGRRVAWPVVRAAARGLWSVAKAAMPKTQPPSPLFQAVERLLADPSLWEVSPADAGRSTLSRADGKALLEFGAGRLLDCTTGNCSALPGLRRHERRRVEAKALELLASVRLREAQAAC